MISQTFCTWVNKLLLSSRHLLPHYPSRVSFYTVVCWLHLLGFKLVSHKKGVCIDGHERKDVVKDQEVYIYIYINCLFDYLNNISLQQEYLKTMSTITQATTSVQ